MFNGNGSVSAYVNKFFHFALWSYFISKTVTYFWPFCISACHHHCQLTVKTMEGFSWNLLRTSCCKRSHHLSLFLLINNTSVIALWSCLVGTILLSVLGHQNWFLTFLKIYNICWFSVTFETMAVVLLNHPLAFGLVAVTNGSLQLGMQHFA